MMKKILFFLLFATAAHAQTSTLYGGTGLRGLAPYSILTGGIGGNNPVIQIPNGASGQILTSNGSALPSWQTAGSLNFDSVATSKKLSIASDYNHTTFINGSSVQNDTLPAPTVLNNGQKWRFVFVTANADTLHSQTIGFNAKGSTGTITVTAAKGNNIEIVAWDGNWYTANGGTNATVH